MKTVHTILAGAVTTLALGLTLPASVYAQEESKITICHATGNPGKYNAITVSVNAAAGVPTSDEVFDALAQSGHFDAGGSPTHTRSWGGSDFWLSGDATSEDCIKGAPPPDPK